MSNALPTQEQFLKTCNFGITSRVFGERRAGQCKRWVRQMQAGSGTLFSYQMPTGIDAKQAGAWWRKVHPALIVKGKMLPGDIAIWEEGHGPHGHMFVVADEFTYMGNSTVFAPEGEEDGRGFWPIRSMKKPSLVVRPWRAKTL